MVEEIKYQTIGKSFAIASSLYFKFFLSMSVLLFIEPIATLAFVYFTEANKEMPLVTILLVKMLISVVLNAFITPFMILKVSQTYTLKSESNLKIFIKTCKNYFRNLNSVFWQGLLTILPLTFFADLLSYATKPISFVQNSSFLPISVTGFLVFLTLYIIFYPRLQSVLAISIIENMGTFKSIKRSMNLNRVNLGQIYGGLALMYAILLGISVIFSIITVYAFPDIFLQGKQSGFFLQVFFLLPYIPIHAISLGLGIVLYFNARVKKEHYDIEFLISRFKKV